jgi:hypothetical protein
MACHAWQRRSSISLAEFFMVVALGACARVEAVPPERAPPAGLPTDVEGLRGLTAVELARLLGEPDFMRQEPPAVVWQYRGATCVLDLFFYRSADELRVAYAETHDRGLVRISQSECYADLVASRARPP